MTTKKKEEKEKEKEDKVHDCWSTTVMMTMTNTTSHNPGY